MDIQHYMQTLGRQARAASRIIAAASTEAKNAALLAMATEVRARLAELLAANARDLEAGRAAGIPSLYLVVPPGQEKDLSSFPEAQRVSGLSEVVERMTTLKNGMPNS